MPEFMPTGYINIHTHSTESSKEVVAIINQDSKFESLSVNSYYSVGLHPWHLNSINTETEFQELKIAAELNNVRAIGECGLDKSCKTDFKLQEIQFRKQIHLANQLHKPLIIHCVRAFEEVISALKEEQNNVSVIFHGFQKGAALAIRILEAGHYLSFGHQLLSTKNEDVFKLVPWERLFLESDNHPIPIETIYQKAASIKGVSVNELANKISNNFDRVFGPCKFESA